MMLFSSLPSDNCSMGLTVDHSYFIKNITRKKKTRGKENMYNAYFGRLISFCTHFQLFVGLPFWCCPCPAFLLDAYIYIVYILYFWSPPSKIPLRVHTPPGRHMRVVRYCVLQRNTSSLYIYLDLTADVFSFFLFTYRSEKIK